MDSPITTTKRTTGGGFFGESRRFKPPSFDICGGSQSAVDPSVAKESAAIFNNRWNNRQAVKETAFICKMLLSPTAVFYARLRTGYPSDLKSGASKAKMAVAIQA
ncbi:hypothetical protein PIB30_057843 [Stylosanthes scabra]|uniref:Uncharacterized protein n=1 Tax=Stylosanthes scabra TaxID=79078 RepID=A0ABU6VLT4_9FABA|nr:hypothetical protein [Stylosanthes scabra]